jgi:hypothetical protein
MNAGSEAAFEAASHDKGCMKMIFTEVRYKAFSIVSSDEYFSIFSQLWDAYATRDLSFSCQKF